MSHNIVTALKYTEPHIIIILIVDINIIIFILLFALITLVLDNRYNNIDNTLPTRIIGTYLVFIRLQSD